MVNLRNFWKGSVVAKQNCHNTKAPPLFFLIMRLNIKVSLIILCCVVLLFVTFWSRCNDTGKEWRKKIDNRDGAGGGEVPGVDEIECDINGEYNIGCRKEGDEVYLPFSFIHKYFEIYGKLTTYDGLDKFEWSHSYGKIYHPKGRYDPRGVFMYFENYNVEVRERVKCVSATEGVPISTQWESQGYYYPTQIAQFGLSHYSKNLTEPEPRRKVLENADKDLDTNLRANIRTTINLNYRIDTSNPSNQVKIGYDLGVSTSVVMFLCEYIDTVDRRQFAVLSKMRRKM